MAAQIGLDQVVGNQPRLVSVAPCRLEDTQCGAV
jgi:hypothetical protein